MYYLAIASTKQSFNEFLIPFSLAILIKYAYLDFFASNSYIATSISSGSLTKSKKLSAVFISS
jgi:hypothetical protein